MFTTNVQYGRKEDKSGGAAAPAPAAPAAAPEISLSEITEAIGGAVAKGLEGIKGIQSETIKAAVAEAMKSVKPADLVPDKVGALAAEAATKAIDSIRRDKKSIWDPNDAVPQARRQIEVPVSWCKGNLPLHGKQLLNCICRRDMNHGIDEADLVKGKSLGDGLVEKYRGGKALTSTGTNLGDEFVPTDLSSELQRRMYLESVLYSVLSANEVQMPSQPYSFPLSTSRPTFYLGSSENTAVTAASAPGTAGITLDAKKFLAQVDFSYELDEDSIVPILPWIQSELAKAAAETWESVLINGDTTATHMDSDTHAITAAAEKAAKGFRRLSLGVSGLYKDIASGGISAANLRAMLKLMGKYAVKPDNLLIVVGPKGYNDLLAVTEVLTVDKIGPRAVVQTGTLANIFGIPIVVSAANRENLNASGVYDGSTVTKGSILVVNKAGFLFGRRREFTVETQKDVTTQTTKVVASFRRAITPPETPSSTIATVVIGYNYTA